MTAPVPFSFGYDPTALISGFFATHSHSQVVVLVDENTHRLCYPLIESVLPPHRRCILPAGEQHKTLATCETVWSFFTEAELDRHGLVIVVGGGVLGDLVGFCAATFKRGVDFLLIPTTLLAQVDASVGGKLGIDFHHLKNHIGVFREPVTTLISTAFLATLPERELRSGFAEVIKHGLIADRALWDQLVCQPHWQASDWSKVVAASVDIKYRVVQLDPTEKGPRKTLNFGHTVGHAIESAALAEGLSIFHGEAIAVGMVCEAFLSSRKGLLPVPQCEAITHYLRSVFGTVALPNGSRVQDLLLQDKKNKGKRILAALLRQIGQAVWDVEITAADVSESLDYYQQTHT